MGSPLGLFYAIQRVLCTPLYRGKANLASSYPLMIYGDKDVIPKSPNLTTFVPNVDVVSLDCDHNIQQEKPQETNQVILHWLEHQATTC